MRRTVWPALALAFIVVLVVPAPAWAARSVYVTRGLDYLHARQGDTGAFEGAAYTPWAILAIVASREAVNGDAWAPAGKTPFEYMESLNHETASGQGSVSNPPAYYAKTIMAYVACGKANRIYTAGTPNKDLLDKLDDYQRADGRFSISSSNPDYAAVNTTIWAVLAMDAVGIGDSRFTTAVNWLQTQQKASGGFPSNVGGTEDVDDTAAAVQALRAGGVSPSADSIEDALDYLHARQRSDGGFPSQATDGRTYAESTAWAIQAIVAVGQDPNGSAWEKSGNTPIEALRRLQASNGAYEHRNGLLATPILTTPQAVIALCEKSFHTFPRTRPSTVSAFKYLPYYKSMSPANNTSLSTSSVTIKATYADGSGGTGIDAKRIRIYLDGQNRTGAASVSSSSLKLSVGGLTNGSHTCEIRIVDRSGNARRITRTFTTSGGSSSGTSTPSTYPTTPGGGGGTYTPTTPPSTLTPTPTPTDTLFPSPDPSASPYSPYPSVGPSVSASAAPVADGGGEDGGVGVMGGVLVASLPAGAALAYLAMRRQSLMMAAAGRGMTLPGGGSAWQRLSARLARPSGPPSPPAGDPS